MLLLLLTAAACTVVYSAPIGLAAAAATTGVHIASFCLSLLLGLGFSLGAPQMILGFPFD